MRSSALPRVLVLTALTVLLVASCGRRFERGAVEGDTYRNRYFGLTVHIPDGMSVERHEGEGGEVLLVLMGGDKSLTVVAEKLAGVYDTEQYAAAVLDKLGGGAEASHETLGGREFMRLRVPRDGYVQDIHVSVFDDYALVITESYFDTPGALLRGVRFDR